MRRGSRAKVKDALLLHTERPSVKSPVRNAAAWSELVPVREWFLYRCAIAAIRGTGLPFMLGGGFGLAAHIGHWRNTKDIDLYILPESRAPLAEALSKAGFVDYYDQLPY